MDRGPLNMKEKDFPSGKTHSSILRLLMQCGHCRPARTQSRVAEGGSKNAASLDRQTGLSHCHKKD